MEIMDQTFIRIKNGEGYINKEIRDSSYDERLQWYNSISKGKLMQILEKYITRRA